MKELLEQIKFNIDKIDSNEDNATYKIEIKVPFELGWIEIMKFIIEEKDNRSIFQLNYKNNEDNFAIFENTITLPTKALYHYYFSFDVNNNTIYYKKNNKEDTSSISLDDMWKMSVNFEVPDWAKGKIMYHIFVDRFNRGNKDPLEELPNRTIHSSWDEDMIVGPNKDGLWNADFYGGDLKGVKDKLDYIKSLGVSIIYLSPIVWSQSNHRYDTSDYELVDPYVGTNKDLKDLCDKAHSMGLKIILDGVFNHTGNDSKYFNEYNHFDELGAYQSQDSKYFPFYRKYIENNKVFFDYWWGMKNLPVCDGNSKEWQQYIYGEGGIIDLWFDLGIDGLRLDVADELSDEFIEGIRKAVKRNKKDGFIIGEVWKNPMRMGRGYIESGKGMDSVMNYFLIDALIRYFKYKDVNKLNEVLKELKIDYPLDTILSSMIFTSTHDITRAINIFGTKEFQYTGEWAWNLINNDRKWQNEYKMTKEELERGKEIYKSYIYTLTFLPGILSIFYGDEVGLEGMGNLSNRKTFPWNNIDYDLLNYFISIGKIRNKEKFLETADFNIIDIN
jgi:4-alpha-glucanotransferase